MMPVLFNIGEFNVYAFGLFLSMAFVLSTFIIWFFARDELKEVEYLDAFLYTCVVTLVSSRAVYILRHLEEFGFNILMYIVVRQTPGLSLLGGFIGAFLFLWWYSNKKKLPFIHLLDLFSLAGSLALVFTKIGQQLGGAGFGKETDFFLKIRIAGLPKYHHPTEFYESIIYLFIFILLLILYKKYQRDKWPEGLVFCMFTVFAAVTIFSLEFLKVYRVYILGLSVRQILAILILLAVLPSLFKKTRQVFRLKKVRKK